MRLQMKKSHLKCEKTHVAAQIKLNEHMNHPKLFVVFVSHSCICICFLRILHTSLASLLSVTLIV